MLQVFTHQNHRLSLTPLDQAALDQIVWIDLLNPTPEEEQIIEELLQIDIPTRDEIREIEISNTLYQENGTVYATASLVTQSDTPDAELHPVSFILKHQILITLRYAEPMAFTLYLNKATHANCECHDGGVILIDLMEMIVGRAADALEKTARSIEDVTRHVFRPSVLSTNTVDKSRISFEEVLMRIGSLGNLISKISEGLVSLARLTSYVEQTSYYFERPKDVHHLDVIFKDLVSLRDYTNTLSNKVAFLLDATLGMISIEQNAIIKIFSVAAVIFLPPTLIASIYGMNFRHMPELGMRFGYPVALFLMIMSAYLPYRFFKKKGWL